MYLFLTSRLSDKLSKAVFLDSSEETISSFQTYSFEQGVAELRCVMLVIKCVWGKSLPGDCVALAFCLFSLDLPGFGFLIIYLLCVICINSQNIGHVFVAWLGKSWKKTSFTL